MRNLFSFWKSYSRKQKIAFVVLCIVFFITSHTVTFFEGSCFSSPCSSLNQSADVNTWMDRYGEITARPLLAPSVLLIPPILRANGYQVETYTDIPLMHAGNWVWTPILYFFSPVILQQINFDQAHESLNQQDARGSYVDPEDIRAMRVGYAISKLLTLFSIPFWTLYAYLIIKGWERSRYTRIVVGILVLMLLTSTLFTWFIMYSMAGTDIATWKVLTGIASES